MVGLIEVLKVGLDSAEGRDRGRVWLGLEGKGRLEQS